MSPSRKRAAVVQLREQFTVSERRACEVLDQPRSSQRYEAKPRDDEEALVKRMRTLVSQRPRFGYRRIGALLRREAWRASDTRVFRLWRREGLKVPQKRGRNGTWAAATKRATCVAPSTRTTSGAGTSCSIARQPAARSSGCRSWTSTRGSVWR